MSEYNIQMNKYNALNAEYDQLYPKPMKHANTHAKDGSDPITPADIGAYSKTESDSLFQDKADTSSVYTKTETNTLLQNKVSKSGDTMTGILSVPKIQITDYGTPIEIGNYIDMHRPDSTSDYDLRMFLNDSSKLCVGEPGVGTFALIHSGNIGSQSVNYANSANNADTVDGWHMNLDPYGWGIKPICAGTGGMTSGATGLSNGHVYLQFE